MRDEINFDEIISKYRSDPYDYQDIFSAHTGMVKAMIDARPAGTSVRP